MKWTERRSLKIIVLLHTKKENKKFGGTNTYLKS